MLKSRHICELISLESKVLQAKHSHTEKLELPEEIQISLHMVYYTLLALNRQLDALPSEEERQTNKQALNDEYINGFWGSD